MSSRPLLVALVATVALVEFAAGVGLAVTWRPHQRRAAGGCDASLAQVRAVPRAWKPGSVGENAGFSPGSSIFGDSDTELRRDLTAMAGLGVRWIRLDIDWSYIGRVPGTLDWCATDRVVGAARGAGLDVLALATYTPSWARPEGSSDKHPPTKAEDFAAFAGAAASRYSAIGVTTWEIWNEPNIASFWAPRPDPAAYTQLLTAAAAAIRTVVPGATILTGGTAPAADRPDGRTIAPDSFLRGVYAAGGRRAFDAVATHPYSYPAQPLDPTTEDWNPFVRLPRLRSVMTDNGDSDKAVWLTEFGAPTGGGARAVGVDAQAAMVDTAFSARRSWPWLGPLLWYSYRDSGAGAGDVEDHFGIVGKDFSGKPAAETFARLMAQALTGP